MKNYKDFNKIYIGVSDIACLTMTGFRKGTGATTQLLCFMEDGGYSAYHVTEKDVSIGKHYELVAEFNSWLKIYDDMELAKSFKADVIRVYRAGDWGCIIQTYNE